jgi:SP family facilitated glucose transporter-like MFS transporter 8
MVAAMARDAHHLYISRILVSMSHAIISTTVYTVEISSKELRGSFSVLESVIRCIGSVLMYSLGLAFRWWEIASLASLVPIIAFTTCMFVPESPVFLVKKGRQEEAELSVARTFGPEYDSRMEVRIISENLKQLRETKSRKSDYVKSIKSHPEVYKPLFIIVFLSLVQQFSGVSVIRAYVVKIFDEVFSDFSHHSVDSFNASMIVTECTAESQTSSMAYVSAILIGVCRLVSSLTLARLLKNFHRRSMYFISIILTILCLITFSSFSYLISSPESLSIENVSVLKWASLVSACLLVFSVQLGVQTLPLLLSGELFPADVRASCKGLTRAITCIFLVLSVKMYPQLESYLSLSGTFFTFSFVMILFFPTVYFILPETKDLSLEMIQQYFTPQVTVWYTDSVA